MENDWVKVESVGYQMKAEILKGMLAENGIECNILNKKDSEFLFGDIELFVAKQNEVKAKALIDEHNEVE